jgi:NAD(P)-dependent dehydrogenase (short-subunit alcohol dehydrogenase family)
MTAPVCVVTGAGGLLGSALCRELRRDFHIVAVYRNRVPDVDSNLQEAVDGGDRTAPQNEVYCVQADLMDRSDVRRLVETAMARFSRIDAIVNSAADTKFHGSLLDLAQAEDHVEQQLQTNCVAPMKLVSAVHHACWKDETGSRTELNRSVVNVSSVSGIYAAKQVGQAYYAASKAALNMLTLCLAVELAPYGVRANAVCPSRFVDPAYMARWTEVIRELLVGHDNGKIVTTI